jgi:hypothetical protein
MIQVMLDEHRANIRRDGSYGAINAELMDAHPGKVSKALAKFIWRAIADGVLIDEHLGEIGQAAFDALQERIAELQKLLTIAFPNAER